MLVALAQRYSVGEHRPGLAAEVPLVVIQEAVERHEDVGW